MADGGIFELEERLKVFCLREGPHLPSKKKTIAKIPEKSFKKVLTMRSEDPTLNFGAAAMTGKKHKLLDPYAVFCKRNLL